MAENSFGTENTVPARIRQLLWEKWDPIGINSEPGACDEYDAYAEDVYTLVRNGRGIDEIADYLKWVQTVRMELAEKPELNRKIAEMAAALRDARISSVLGDITDLDVDAIVNAANEGLLRGAGVCGAIFRAAGPQLEEACRAVAPCPTGEARVTRGFDAKAHLIVHAVGPVWRGGNSGEPQLLASAYRNSLVAARHFRAQSIAFPAISTGVYGYPREEAAGVAVQTVREWCGESTEPERVVFCCFSEADKAVYDALLSR